jgi:hypothetical protein
VTRRPTRPPRRWRLSSPPRSVLPVGAGNGVMAFDLQRPLRWHRAAEKHFGGSSPNGSRARRRSARDKRHHGDPHRVQTLQVRAHDVVLAPHRHCNLFVRHAPERPRSSAACTCGYETHAPKDYARMVGSLRSKEALLWE